MGDNGNTFARFCEAVYRVVDGPVVWFREKVIVPNHKHYPWYHQKYSRVPTIDQCYTDDPVCEYEANVQFKIDRSVDTEILTILRQRYEDCMHHYDPDFEPCRPLWESYKDGEENWFIKYGDLGYYGDATRAYMKQKHRMLWERRHGPVGTGMRTEEKTVD